MGTCQHLKERGGDVLCNLRNISLCRKRDWDASPNIAEFYPCFNNPEKCRRLYEKSSRTERES
jgi:hypothetical protein